MATQKVEREIVIQSIEPYLNKEVLPITAETIVGSKEASFFNRVAILSGKCLVG
jgi:hypothetical protein